MKFLIHLLGAVALSLSLAQTARAANATVTAATSPARGGFMILVGDINGQQIYLALSATMSGANNDLVSLPVFLAGQAVTITVNPPPATTVMTESGSPLHMTGVLGMVPMQIGVPGSTTITINNILGIVRMEVVPGSTDFSMPKTKTVSVTPTIFSGTDYVDNGTVGNSMVFVNIVLTDADGGILQSLRLVDDSGDEPTCKIWLFNQAITPSSDTLPFSIPEADMDNWIETVTITAGNWDDYGSGSAAARSGLGIAFTSAARSIVAVIQLQGTYNAANTDDLTLSLTVLPDK